MKSGMIVAVLPASVVLYVIASRKQCGVKFVTNAASNDASTMN